jgi:flagellar biogenesis protein FliO
VTGTGRSRPASRARRVLGNVITIVLLVIAAALILRRFGVVHL